MTWRLWPLAVRVARLGWPGIWLPMFVLWPLLGAVFLVLVPLCWLVPSRGWSAFSALLATHRALCALHGTELELSLSPGRTWTFSLY